MPLDGLRRAHHHDERPRAGDDTVRARRGGGDPARVRGHRPARPLLVVGAFGPGAHAPGPANQTRAKEPLHDSAAGTSDARCDWPCLYASLAPLFHTPTRSPSGVPCLPSHTNENVLLPAPLTLTALYRPPTPHPPPPHLLTPPRAHRNALRARALRWRKGRFPASPCAPTARTAPRSSHRRATAVVAT